jgi:copper ion binding protein
MSTTTYAVSGMTCSHCVSAVTDEIGRLGGVSDVSIDLVPNGKSKVTVTSEAPLSEIDVRDAVDEAGYELVGTPG